MSTQILKPIVLRSKVDDYPIIILPSSSIDPDKWENLASGIMESVMTEVQRNGNRSVHKSVTSLVAAHSAGCTILRPDNCFQCDPTDVFE